jgi:hypothetical protein
MSRGEKRVVHQLDATQTSQFLRLALVGNRPVDRLIDRLRRPDGKKWFGQLLEMGPLGRLQGDVEGCLVGGSVTLEDLLAVKDAGKAFYAEVRDPDQRLMGAATYFLVVAAAVLHHRELITSQSHADLDPIFFELSEVCPSPYADFFARAAVAASEM